jgi:hypothetical protein
MVPVMPGNSSQLPEDSGRPSRSFTDQARAANADEWRQLELVLLRVPAHAFEHRGEASYRLFPTRLVIGVTPQIRDQHGIFFESGILPAVHTDNSHAHVGAAEVTARNAVMPREHSCRSEFFIFVFAYRVHLKTPSSVEEYLPECAPACSVAHEPIFVAQIRVVRGNRDQSDMGSTVTREAFRVHHWVVPMQARLTLAC